jgi:hypothetical protein
MQYKCVIVFEVRPFMREVTMSHRIVRNMIRSILDDTAFGHKLVCATAQLYTKLGQPIQLGIDIDSYAKFGFQLRRNLIEGQTIKSDPALHAEKLLMASRLDYIRGMSLSVSATLALWHRDGKQVFFVPQVESIEWQTGPNLLSQVPHGVTMLWLDKTITGTTVDAQLKSVTANLVTLEREGDYVTLRVFTNPERYNGAPLFGVQVENEIESGLTRIIKSQKRSERIRLDNGKEVIAPAGFSVFTKRLVALNMKMNARYPFGSPGVLSVGWNVATNHMYQSQEGINGSVVINAVKQVIGWLKWKSEFEYVGITDQITTDTKRLLVKMTHQSAFEPGDVFEISRVRYEKVTPRHSADVNGAIHESTGRKMSKHTRGSHTRTYTKGRAVPLVIEIGEVHVEGTGIPTGTLVMPRRKRKKPEEGA